MTIGQLGVVRAGTLAGDLILTASRRITITAITDTTITMAVRGGTIGIVITVVDGGVEVRVPRVNRRHNVRAADQRM